MALLETDPIDWKLDENHQLLVPLQRIAGVEAVAQRISIRLQTFRDELFYDQDVGVRWLPGDPDDPNAVQEADAILGQPFDDGVRLRAELRTQIVTTPGVVALPVFRTAFDAPARTATITFRARTAFGDTDLTTVVVALP